MASFRTIFCNILAEIVMVNIRLSTSMCEKGVKSGG
jgi:hypothetical protein